MADQSTGAARLGRRDWLKVTAVSALTAGAVAGSFPYLRDLASVPLAVPQKTIVDLSEIGPGEVKTVGCSACEVYTRYARPNDKIPVLILHRTEEMIEKARKKTKIDPEADFERTQQPEWLVVVGFCTHLGCIPQWKPEGDRAWLCNCHGSEYDFAGRVIKGPAQRNFDIPPYRILDDSTLELGHDEDYFRRYALPAQT